MAFLTNLFKQRNTQNSLLKIVSPVEGVKIPIDTIADPIFSEQMMGQTIAFRPTKDVIVSPATGVLEVMFPTGHAFAILMSNGVCLLVHIGINSVNLNGKGFQVLAKQGERVKAGQPIVIANFNKMEEECLDTSTMLIVTDLGKEISEIHFNDELQVCCGQTISICKSES